MAVSGYNVAVLAGTVSFLLLRLVGRRWLILPLLITIAAYTAITGAPPSAVRASLMVGAALLATSWGRIADPLTSVVAVGTLMAFWQPSVLLDIGFQLSFAATLGLILLSPAIADFLRQRLHAPRLLAEPLALTLAAQLATLPIVLSVFQHLSLVAPLANVLATPLVPAIMFSAALLALTLPVEPIAWSMAALTWLPTSLLATLVESVGSLPNAGLYTGVLPAPAAALFAAALLAWGLWRLPDAATLRTAVSAWNSRLLGENAPRRVLSGALLAALLLGGTLALTRPDGRLHVSVLAAGTGQAVLVRAPSGTTVLVTDGEAEPRGLAALVGSRLRLWENRLSAVVVIAPDDELGLGEVVRRYPPDLRLAADRDLRLDLGGGAVLDVYPDPQRGPSAAITYGNVWLQLSGRPTPPELLDLNTSEDLTPSTTLLAAVAGADWPEHQPPLWLAVGQPRNSATATATYALDRPREAALDLVSDGAALWPSRAN